MATKINKIGVIGAGQMGNGISQVCARAGHDVYLMDINEDYLAAALKIANLNYLTMHLAYVTRRKLVKKLNS